MIASKPCRESALVLAMLTEQLIHPSSKLGTTRLWSTTTLASELEVQGADEDDLYAAMDWLARRQSRIEKKLAARHLSEGAQVLYNVSSSHYEGRTCSLAQFGHDRDKKKGKRIIVSGAMTDADGRPIAIQVYPGNTGDPTTVPEQVHKLRRRFGLERVVLVGDRGMLTQTQIDAVKSHPGLGWISALKFRSIRKLADDDCLQLSLFDERNLAEISSPDFPQERLIVCKNPLLAAERHRKRDELLAATETGLKKIVKEVARRTKTPLTAAEIAKKVGKVSHRFKMDKHFKMTIEDNLFHYQRDEVSIKREVELDGIYVIRTSEPIEQLSPEDVVRNYKNLSRVEQLFRTIKGIDRVARPIRHRNENRVHAHFFLCMLTYYIKWHMRKALAPLLFDDEELDADRLTRDPVAPAQPSDSAKRKKSARRTEDGPLYSLHSFDTLLAALATRCRNRCRV
ncbi:MAG: IS1634 family transposase, partial [Proteobacteria bacterium]|nr:IS1634 family transposase [Pseudomonadota bacterium]